MKRAGLWAILGLAVIASVTYLYLQKASTETSETSETSETLVSEEPKDFSTKSLHDYSGIDSLYKIWVRSFNDSNNDGHGDLAGITSKLGYLKELGIKNILLSPIFKSPAYHGYEVSDYLQIQPEYGSENDLVELIGQASSLSINIFLDIPLNHTSDQHPWFVSSVNDVPEYRDYYVWHDSLPPEYGVPWLDSPSPASVFHTKTQKHGYYYGVFGYASPDLNFRNPRVVSEVKEVLAYWINIGVRGFRIDAARYLLEEGPLEGQRDTLSNLKLLADLKAYARSIDPDVDFIGEVFANDEVVKRYLDHTDGLDSYFNFQFGFSLKSIISDRGLDIYEKIRHMQSIYNDTPFEGKHFPRQIALLNNQDLERTRMNAFGDYKLLYSLFLTSPYAVSLYYGEEVALVSHEADSDIFYRDIMSWNCSGNSLNNRNSTWLMRNLNQEDLNAYQAWLRGSERDSQLANCEQLTNHIAKLLKLRGLNSEFFPYSGNVDTDLSSDDFYVSALTGPKNTLFVIVNMDISRKKLFNIETLPNLSFTNVITKENYGFIDSVEIDAADALILVGN